MAGGGAENIVDKVVKWLPMEWEENGLVEQGVKHVSHIFWHRLLSFLLLVCANVSLSYEVFPDHSNDECFPLCLTVSLAYFIFLCKTYYHLTCHIFCLIFCFLFVSVTGILGP